MKKIIIVLMALAPFSANANEVILHPSCEIWVPTWQPQGQGKTLELKGVLSAKGYKPIFSGLGTTRDSKPLFLGQKEAVKTAPSAFSKGRIQLSLKLQAIDADDKYSDVFVAQQSVICKYRFNGSSYYQYNSNCSVLLKDSAAQLPDCNISSLH